MMKETVAAIIPAYNEAKTIGEVVRVACVSPFIDEVIVVSDGSTDDTVSSAKKAGARVLSLRKNVGKGEAMMKGLLSTHASVILFLDADLLGLTTDHLAKLVRPVLDRSCAMQVGIRDRGWFFTALTHRFPLISGERALRREIADGIPRAMYRGYMIEAAYNYYCRSRGLTYGIVDLKRLSIRRKYEKVGWSKAVVQYLSMTCQIVFAMIVVRVARIFGKF